MHINKNTFFWLPKYIDLSTQETSLEKKELFSDNKANKKQLGKQETIYHCIYPLRKTENPKNSPSN